MIEASNSMKVLVAVDGSASAQRALDFAINEARQRHAAHLHVLTVHAPPLVYGEVGIYMGLNRAEQLAAQHDRYILEEVEPRLQAAGVRYSAEALEGDPAETIARRARELACTQIVMGTRGLGRAAGLMLGSIATKVVQLATMPVTLVK